MADVITRFKLETTQFDSKLRDASKNMSAMVKHMSLAGDEFGKFTQSSVEQARALGKIGSGANNLKDKLKDLVGAYNDVARQYNVLTKEQQNTEFGKALAESLQTLQGRIRDTKSEMNAVPGVLDKLADKFTVNIDAMKLFDMGLQAAGAALDVAKDAFFASEQNLDDWNRAVYASKSVYEGFLTSLNTSDVSGYLSRIDQIVSAANDAYNAIDRLQTTRNIQTPQMQAKQAEVQRMETMLRTGRYIAPVDGRRGSMDEGTILNDDQKKRIADNLASAMSEIATMTKTEVQRSTDAINALYKEQALRLGMSNEQFRKGTETVAAFEANLEKARKYQEWEAQHTSVVTSAQTGGTMSIRSGGTNPYEAYKGWGVFKDDGELYQSLLGLIRDRTASESQYYGQVGRAYRGINRGEGLSMYGSAGGTTKAEQTELQKNQKAIADLTEEYQRLADASKNATGQSLSAATERMTAIKTEIKALQDRNDELKRWADEAASKTTGLIEEQTKKAARLNEELTHATTVADIQRINKEMDATNDRLTILQGKLPENKAAEFKVEVDAKQLAELQDMLPKGATITERVNVEQGKVDMPDVPTEDKTIKVNVEQGEVDMPDVPTDVKQLVTVTADTAEAAQAIAALVDGNYTVTISAKMNMEEGFAGLSDNALSTYIAGLKKDLSGEEIGSDFYNKIAQNMGDATALQSVIKAAVSSGLDLSGFDFEMPWEKILSFDDADGALTSLIDQINEKLKEIGKDPIVIDLKTGDAVSKDVVKNAKETQQAWSAAASAINSAGSAMQNMEDPAAKVSGIVMQAIANVALGFAQASASPATGAAGVFGWIAAATAGLATMTATIASIKNATKGFAEGGIVPGNSFSGDMLRTSDYGINSGELILNKAQQNSIAGQLEEGGNGMTIGGTPYVTGETVILGINNTLRRQGRGELVTTGTLRRLGIM